MRAYMKKLFCVFLGFILLLISCAPPPPKIYWPDVKWSRREQPIVISIDRDFTSDQQSHIDNAMHAWETASSGKVKFVTTWDVFRPGPLQLFIPLKSDQGIFLWYTHKDKYQLSPSMLEDAIPWGGLTIFGPGEHSVHVIIFQDTPKQVFYDVALHELGHLIGLNHINGRSVMHKNVVSNCITELDAKQLCELYGCDPKPDCPI